MNEKRPKTTFGKILEQYRFARNLTQSDLERLVIVNGYPMSMGLLSKYESGKRRPSADFIAIVSRCLKLTQNQFKALLDARVVDESQNLYDEFQSSFERHESTVDIDKFHPLKVPNKGESTHRAKKQGTKRLLKVFLCHSSGDKPFVRDLYKRLRGDGFNPWLDEEALLPGQDWDQEIQKAVRNTDVVVVCLSSSSVTKAGYVQKEIRLALDAAEMQPENTIFIIPLKVEECDVPERLRRWQWVSLYEKRGYELLIKALRSRAKDLQI